MAIPYWGRKDKEYMNEIIGLYPDSEIELVVDACMGSGSFSENISCQLEGVERIAFELDKGVFIMHKMIKEKWDTLIKRMLDFDFSEKTYKECREKVSEVLSGSSEYDEVEIALDELVLLYFSHNSMRGNNPRKLDTYEKYENEKDKMRNKRQLELIGDKFYTKAPGVIVSLNAKWKNLIIQNDNFMNHTDLWKNPKAWIFIDPPYELSKRGIDESRIVQANGKFGYDVDMTLKEHDEFLSKVIDIHRAGQLQAKIIICTCYEVDDNGDLIIPEDDRYKKLVQYGFRLFEIKKRAASNYYEKTKAVKQGEVEKRRRKKMEVVYINYKTI